MKREIEFKAKCQETNDWVYGYLVKVGGGYVIITDTECHNNLPEGSGIDLGYTKEEFKVVKPDTIGQYVGMKDKNGKKIYEGDILNMTDLDEGTSWNTKVEEYGIVEYHSLDYDYCMLRFVSDVDDWVEFEVIGNIHDNPELMEAKGE